MQITSQTGELPWCSGSIMDCHATAPGSIPGRDGVFTEFHVHLKGQEMGVSSLNDLAVNGTLITNKQTSQTPFFRQSLLLKQFIRVYI